MSWGHRSWVQITPSPHLFVGRVLGGSYVTVSGAAWSLAALSVRATDWTKLGPLDDIGVVWRQGGGLGGEGRGVRE